MDSWHKDYLLNKEEYLKLFDTTMQKEQETNVEFLEKSLIKLTGRNYAVVCSNGTDALHFSLISLEVMKLLRQTSLGYLQRHVYQWLVPLLCFVILIYRLITCHLTV